MTRGLERGRPLGNLSEADWLDDVEKRFEHGAPANDPRVPMPPVASDRARPRADRHWLAGVEEQFEAAADPATPAAMPPEEAPAAAPPAPAVAAVPAREVAELAGQVEELTAWLDGGVAPAVAVLAEAPRAAAPEPVAEVPCTAPSLEQVAARLAQFDSDLVRTAAAFELSDDRFARVVRRWYPMPS